MRRGGILRGLDVSIHAPREGERLPLVKISATKSPFQSTLPARGSDFGRPIAFHRAFVFQSTLPARGSDMGERGHEEM